jgi:filamentous hemagglutinin family protein
MENSLKRIFYLLACPSLVMALVEEPQASSGVIFSNPNANTQLIQAPDKAVINCKKFNVGKQETVHFIQPHSKASALCRVTGKEASIIEGILKADGRLFIVNPQSIYFRETAKVDVHSLIASTLNIKDEDFAKGNYRFFLDSDAKDSVIVTQGKITAGQDVIFMAPQILNRAAVKATAGRVEFLGGELITLNFEGDNLISFAIDEPLQKGIILQAGQIEAGMEVLLKLRVVDQTIRSVVNIEGMEPASSMKFENGKIFLVAQSSIAAPTIKVEGPLVETAGDFAKVAHLEINTEKEMLVLGGNVKSSLGSAEVSLTVLKGMLTFAGPFNYTREILKDKDALKTLRFGATIIDQNAAVKGMGHIMYSAEKILLSANTSAPNDHITFNGPVTIDGDKVKISSGLSKGDIKFNSSLEADHPSRSLTISNGAGTVSFKEPIGVKGAFSELSIDTGKLYLPNIGDRNRRGAKKLTVKAGEVEFIGTIAHAKKQLWTVPHLHLSSGQPTIFISRNKPLVFASPTHIFLNPGTDVVFETYGGKLELSKLSGDHHQTITINTGLGEAKTGELVGGIHGKLGKLHVEGRDIHITGKIDVGGIFMEAQENISYSIDSERKIFSYEVCSHEDITLNARRGNVGLKDLPLDLPILVNSEGKLYLGAKSYAYVKGSFKHGYPYVYQKNPPPWMIYNGIETQYVFNKEIFMEEEIILSLIPDLFHAIPQGFVDVKSFTFRRAPIYCAEYDKKISDSTEETPVTELSQAEE